LSKKQLTGPYANDPKVKQGIRQALGNMLHWMQTTEDGHNQAWYVEMILELEELLPLLKKDPMYAKIASDIEFTLQADKNLMGI
jgi:hypothetical protein